MRTARGARLATQTAIATIWPARDEPPLAALRLGALAKEYPEAPEEIGEGVEAERPPAPLCRARDREESAAMDRLLSNVKVDLHLNGDFYSASLKQP